ncbi:salicylate synthase [Streptomyces sp. NPDC050617]|uniref:salicylate synthase n=1 Tax=Streptomyces sp. NPDC050617 TaxID=3154628 RepID=UPI003434159B
MTEQHHHTSVEGPLDPLAAATCVAASGLLGDYVVYEQEGTWHIAGDARAEILVDARGVRTRGTGTAETTSPLTGNPWRAIRSALDRIGPGEWNAYGWLAFELGDGGLHEASSLPPDAPGADTLLGHLIVPATELTLTPRGATIRSADPAVIGRVAKLLDAAPWKDERSPAPAPVDVHTPHTEYHDHVSRAVTEIAAGRLEKVILSRTVTVPFGVDMPATYLAGRRANTPARSFLLDLDGLQTAGFSPETVIEAPGDGTASTQPLAGTRALTGDAGTDAVLRAELHRDPKEVHEHAMSVRLAVEELTRIGAPDTTRVTEFLTVKPRGSVQHLASRVVTDLAPDHSGWDALGAVFPPVTASGIPKQAARRLIRELESERRGPYAGAVLRASSDGALDAALVLRAVYQRGGRAWLRAGAGVVGASRPAREYEETCEKLRSVAPHVVPREV